MNDGQNWAEITATPLCGWGADRREGNLRPLIEETEDAEGCTSVIGARGDKYGWVGGLDRDKRVRRAAEWRCGI